MSRRKVRSNRDIYIRCADNPWGVTWPDLSDHWSVLLSLSRVWLIPAQVHCSTHDTLHAAHCTTLHTAHCTLHTAHCTLHTAHCTLHTAHCALHSAPGNHEGFTVNSFPTGAEIDTVVSGDWLYGGLAKVLYCPVHYTSRYCSVLYIALLRCTLHYTSKAM